MRRGTYLTHRLGPKGPALRLADVSRRRLLDHIGEFTPRAFEVGKGRIRGLAFCLPALYDLRPCPAPCVWNSKVRSTTC